MMLTKLARKILESVTPYIPGKPIEEVQRELGLPTVIKLASNENPLGPSPKAVEAIRNALPSLHRYPDGSSFYLVRKLAAHLGVAPEQLIIGNGSDEIITLAVRAFVEPGEEIVIAHPTFLIYKIAGQLAEARVRTVPLKDFRYDLAAMRKAVTPKTKMVFIANPDNPTGSYVTKAEVEAFLESLSPEVIVFFDEAYAELADVPDYPDTRPLLGKRPVIIARTFSKAYGLAGLRVGYGMAPKELVEAMNRVREPFNVNSLAQVAAAAALEDTQHLEATRRLLREEKKKLNGALKEMGFSCVPSATNFILFHAGPKAGELAQALLKKGIIVRHLQAWDLPEFLRVTVGLAVENDAFIQNLKQLRRESS
ncbi:MAG: histidinol-phosphate transaminase [Candidatus Omnitrophota bacterium]|nr:histidinol-phosphate transaminase [Candidatus Omnitrophota bacterium]